MADSCYVIKEYKPKKKKSKKRRLIKVAVIFSVLIGLGFWYYFGRIAPVVFTIVEERTRMLISEAVDNSVNELVVNLTHDDYVIMRTDSDGNLTYLGINSVSMNKFSRSITDSVRSKLKQFENSGIDIPLGAFTGIAFMSAVGPDVQLRATSLATVDATYASSFIDGGINQTLHRLYIVIGVSVEIVLPGNVRSIAVSSQILISESIIVGKTPNTYLDF